MSEKSFKGKISAKGMNIKEILKTGRLILREMSLDDLHETRKIVCDEQTMWAWNGAWSEEENLAGLEKQLRGYTEDGFGRWAVILKETGAFIGMCGLQWCETDKEKVLEIGYLFNRDYWHNGYATEAVIACKHYAFDHLGFDEVFSLVRDINIPSMNVAIRNGMVIRGRFIKRYKGEDMPHIVFCIKRMDWLSEFAASDPVAQ
ncbi:MAG: GNAT family N-acetyltransferase [Firmicutes bacterium]|nr:GNAT family N-acetyltransferase [Bacillota bacterium]